MCVEVSLSHIPVINFSMQQNHVPVIREIVVKNNGETDMENVDINVTFDPAFADDVDLHIDRIAPGASAILTDIPVHVSTTYLSELTERIEGLIKVTVTSPDREPVTHTADISVLAFDQWGGLCVLPAMLAAFVTPNHPETTRVIHRASEILAKWTGSPSLDEYQTRDPNRVKLQMAAIFEAIAELRIVYCTVPASFEDYGQRVRLYSDIISTRMATCLDMALFYAGCLEAVGIHPVVVIVKGHAFAGAWLIDESFPDSVNDDVSLLTKRTAEGINEMLVVETTCMNAGSPASFDDAVRLAADRLIDADNFHLFIDLKRARNARIRPLPLRVMRDGAFIIEEPAPAERHADAPEAVAATVTVEHVEHIEVDKQTIWERKLLDLSLRNNLLNTRITNNTIQLISASVNEIEDALAAGVEFQILPKPTDWDNPLMSVGIYQSLNAANPITELVRSEIKQKRLYSYLGPDPLRRTLTHLYRSSRLALEENGANTLYLAVGLLKWFETPASTRPRFAPLLLIPVEIIRKTAAKGYIIRSRDEDTVLNITLLEMLRQNFGISIGGLDPLPADECGVDVNMIFSVFRRAIMSQTGWDVEEQVIIGNFSFSKFIMWNDIHSNADKLSRNKIVASLISGKTEWTDADDTTDSDTTDLDEAYPAGSVALPIGADSSQFRAICAAVDGRSFILHGPPGTGKSQTITNIIANALYNGRKVLFVAEKMAALQVVQRRLEAIGLAPFCLELHSNKTKKSYILEQLKRTTEVARRRPDENFALKATQINELRRELNGYITALHKSFPAGLSLYDCFAGYASTPADIKCVDLPQQFIASQTRASRAAAEVTVAEYQTLVRVCGTPSDHPLAGIELTEYSAVIKTEAREHLERLSEAITSYRAALSRLSELMQYDFGIPDSARLEALNGIFSILSDAKALPIQMLKAAGDPTLTELIERAAACGSKRDEAASEILRDYTPDILSQNFRPWEQLWRDSAGKWVLGRWLGRRKVMSQLRAFHRGGQMTVESIDRLFVALNDYSDRSRELSGMEPEVRPVAGNLWRNDGADWELLAKAARDCEILSRRIFMLTGNINKATQLKDVICRNLECGLATFRDIFGRTVEAVTDGGRKVAGETAEVTRLLDAPSLAEMPLDERCASARLWAAEIDKLHDFAACNAQRARVVEAGLEVLADKVDSGDIKPDEITASYSRSFFRSYAEYILSLQKDLNLFHGMLFDEKVERFRRLSAEFERLTREELYAKLASSLPAFRKEAAQGSEVGILQRNIRNGGRGTSIRRLFDQIPDLLTRMCPCMLMSPISVAQYISPDMALFDLVIFDEASQMPTSEAVGAIARGKNVVVVGDPKQMPPTNFFSTSTFDEDNAGKEDLENILEDCLALSMPSKYLLWHYRSRHESLIAFSNANYYDNRLLTFPSPDDLTTKVGWQYVDGIYDRGRSRQNRAEAEAVIEEIRLRLSSPDTAHRSIGVVTFNTNQQSLIEDLLTDLFSHNPDLEAAANLLDEDIFVKNLENVQGDERDVILFSIGYGPDKEGKVALNFGPLNRDGGGRRLNVAVSRARYEMKVFSSLRADMIDLNRTSAEGVADLKSFLEYAEKGRDYLSGHGSSASEAGSADALVESVAARLAERGYKVMTDIGCSGFRIDIGVVDPRDPDKYLLGILCDGPNYSSAGTANDRVVSQDAVLRQLGWHTYHVWAMDWWENPDKAIDGIVSAISRVETSEPVASVPALPAPPAQTEPDNVTDEEPDPSVQPYRKCVLGPEGITPEEFVSGAYDTQILNKISAVIATEGPVSKSLVCRRIMTSYGYARMGARLSAHLDRLLASPQLRSTGSGDATFYWSTDSDPDTYAVYRPESEREALDIAPQEMAAAIVRILDEQGSLPLDSLRREVAQRFGFARVGENVSAAVSRAVDCAVALGRISVTDDRVKIV